MLRSAMLRVARNQRVKRLVLAFPLIGHATWHAYRELVPAEVAHVDAPRIARDVVV